MSVVQEGAKFHRGFRGEKGQDAPRVIAFLGGKILELTVFLNKKWLLKHQSFCSHVFKDVFWSSCGSMQLNASRTSSFLSLLRDCPLFGGTMISEKWVEREPMPEPKSSLSA